MIARTLKEHFYSRSKDPRYFIDNIKNSNPLVSNIAVNLNELKTLLSQGGTTQDEITTLLASVKPIILKKLSDDVKNPKQFLYVRRLLVDLKKLGQTWPELGKIQTALNNTSLKETISDKPGINAQIEKLLEKEPKEQQSLIIDALETLQNAGAGGLSPQDWAKKFKEIRPDGDYSVMDLLKKVVKTYTCCVKRVKAGLYVWDDSDRGIDDVDPETRAAVGNQVKLGDMVMRVMKRGGDFTIDEIARHVAERTQMPQAQAQEYVKHIIDQFVGNTILSLGNGRYRVNVDKPATADDQIADMKKLAGLGPKT